MTTEQPPGRQCSLCLNPRRVNRMGFCSSCTEICENSDNHELREVYKYARMVWKIAIRATKRMTGKAIGSLADLFQTGMVGLLKGIRSFDPSRGFKQTTHYYAQVWGYIRQRCDRDNGLIRVPPQLLNGKRNGYVSSDAKMAEYLRKVRAATGVCVFGSTPIEAITPAGDACNQADDESRIGSDEIQILSRTLARIDKRMASIVRMYYGIGCERMTLVGIGRALGISKERVRQIKLMAMEKLKDIMNPQVPDSQIPTETP